VFFGERLYEKEFHFINALLLEILIHYQLLYNQEIVNKKKPSHKEMVFLLGNK
jgi:hypothetical protein